MASQQQEKPAERTQCAEEFCPFFANECTDGLCSQCYKNRMSRTLLTAEVASSSAKSVARSDSVVTSEEPATAASPPPPLTSTSEPPAEENGPPRKKNRCFCCNKKVGLLGFECNKCHKVLCAAHRTAEDHFCEWNHKEEGRKRLAAENPLVACMKIDRL